MCHQSRTCTIRSSWHQLTCIQLPNISKREILPTTSTKHIHLAIDNCSSMVTAIMKAHTTHTHSTHNKQTNTIKTVTQLYVQVADGWTENSVALRIMARNYLLELKFHSSVQVQFIADWQPGGKPNCSIHTRPKKIIWLDTSGKHFKHNQQGNLSVICFGKWLSLQLWELPTKSEEES